MTDPRLLASYTRVMRGQCIGVVELLRVDDQGAARTRPPVAWRRARAAHDERLGQLSRAPAETVRAPAAAAS